MQPRRTRDVVGLLPALGDAPADRLFDLARVEPGPVEQPPLRRPQQLGRVHAGQRAAAAPDRRADRVDDHRNAHGGLPKIGTCKIRKSRTCFYIKPQ
jgi:hypothetical protein